MPRGRTEKKKEGIEEIVKLAQGTQEEEKKKSPAKEEQKQGEGSVLHTSAVPLSEECILGDAVEPRRQFI